MKTSHLTNDRGELTPKALADGHVQRKDNVSLTRISEGTYDVIAYNTRNKLVFWESYDNLTHAREAFKEQVRHTD